MTTNTAEHLSESVSRAVFPAMGNTAHVTIVGGDAHLLEIARLRLERLEELWSRFIASSDISLLNAAGGKPVPVSSETSLLVRYMVAGWSLTQGLFDPSMLGELVQAGYDRSFTSAALTVLPTGVEWTKDLGSVCVDGDVVTVPYGLVLDPGGIGKGLAADIVARELVDEGAAGVFVSVGGDIRCIGTGDCNGDWIIDVESPFDGTPLCSVALREGAVATSSLTAKMFSSPESESDGVLRSHIMDPGSRRTIDAESRDVVQATVIAQECVWAEVFTKAYLVMDSTTRIEFAADHGLDAMVVCADGSTTVSHGWTRYQR